MAGSSNWTIASTTSSTASNYYTIVVPPNTSVQRINIPQLSFDTPLSVYNPGPLPEKYETCKHDNWNHSKLSCDDCHVTAQAIAEAQLKYRRPSPLEFNKYINASDLMEEFIEFLGENKVKQQEAWNIPIEHFIKWLIIRACEEDKEEANVTLELPSPKKQPRCMGCQKFMPKLIEAPFHTEICAGFYFSRQKAVVN